MTDIASIGAGAPSAAELADPLKAKTWRAAQEFEAMTLGQFLQPMFATVDPSAGPFGGGSAESTWRPMLVDEIARTMAHGGGVGLAASVYRQMLRTQEGS